MNLYGAFVLGCVTAAVLAAATWWLHERLRRAARANLAAEFAAQVSQLEVQSAARLEAALAQARAQLDAALADALRAQAGEAAQAHAGLRDEQLREHEHQARERAALQVHVQGQLDAMRLAHQALLAADGEARRAELLAVRGELGTHRTEVLQHLKEQDATLRSEFGEFRRTAAGLWEAHYGHVETMVKQRLETAQKLGELGARVHGAEAIARQVEETVWEIRGVPLNVLRSQLLVLQSALDAGERPRVERVLARIPKGLEALQAGGQRLDPWTLDRLAESLERADRLVPEGAKAVRRAVERLAADEAPQEPPEDAATPALPATSSRA